MIKFCNKILSLILSLFTVFVAVSPVSFAVSAATYRQSLLDKGFPESYVDELVELHKKYPKWDFEPFDTGLVWESAVDGERAARHSQQSIQKISGRSNAFYCSCKNCKKDGEYVVTEAPNWVSASEAAVKYYMDPRNWLTPKYIFQFESMKYSSNAKQSAVESILGSSFMHNSNITYINCSGAEKTFKQSGSTVKYSKAFMDAGKDADVNPYFLASKVMLEIGSSSASRASGSSGVREPFCGIYNYYSIGATANADNGLEWASGFLRTTKTTTLYSGYNNTDDAGKGTETKLKAETYFSYRGSYGSFYKGKVYVKNGNSYTQNGKIGYIKKSDVRTTYLTYGRPWVNPYKTIYYGAKYLYNTFGKYQFNDYLQKYNVNSKSGYLHACEYSITVNAPVKASELTYKAYSDAGVLSEAHTFYIPVFDRMPAKNCTVDGSSSDSDNDEDTSNKVTGLTLTARTKETLSFKWNKFSGATKYYIHINNKTKGTTFDKTVSANYATLGGLTAANQYSVKVKAYTSKGWSDYSSVNTKHTVPPKAGGLKKGATGAASVKLSWNKITGASGYNIYSYNSSTKKYTRLQGFTTNSGTVKSLKGGTTYKLCVAAYVKDGSSIKIGGKSATVTVKTKPRKVTLKSVTAPGGEKIKVTWYKPSGGVSGYEIVWAKDSAFKQRVADKLVSGGKTTSYTGKNFTKGHSYYVRVRAYKNYSGKKTYGAWSAAKKVTCK